MMSEAEHPFRVLAFRDAHARRILLEIAQRYARRRIIEVATVRDTPKLSADDAVLLADYRFTLETATGGDLPQVAEPVWPIVHRMQDWEGGDKFRKGSKKAPTFRMHQVKPVAEAWAAAIVGQLFLDQNDESAALSDESREKMLDALPEGAGGGS